MSFYFVKKPKWLRSFYGDCTWEMNTQDRVLYLTFDDGPDPEITPFVLDQLAKYNAKATFFCIGKHVIEHPQIFESVLYEGHAVGNHSYSHLDGWKTDNKKYLDDIAEASKVIFTNLYRPPFGHITPFQVDHLKREEFGLKTILWNILSADFDEATPKEQCLHNVTHNAEPGSIVLLHDHTVASKNLHYALPKILEHFSKEGYRFDAIAA